MSASETCAGRFWVLYSGRRLSLYLFLFPRLGCGRWAGWSWRSPGSWCLLSFTSARCPIVLRSVAVSHCRCRVVRHRLWAFIFQVSLASTFSDFCLCSILRLMLLHPLLVFRKRYPSPYSASSRRYSWWVLPASLACSWSSIVLIASLRHSDLTVLLYPRPIWMWYEVAKKYLRVRSYPRWTRLIQPSRAIWLASSCLRLSPCGLLGLMSVYSSLGWKHTVGSMSRAYSNLSLSDELVGCQRSGDFLVDAALLPDLWMALLMTRAGSGMYWHENSSSLGSEVAWRWLSQLEKLTAWAWPWALSPSKVSQTWTKTDPSASSTWNMVVWLMVAESYSWSSVKILSWLLYFCSTPVLRRPPPSIEMVLGPYRLYSAQYRLSSETCYFWPSDLSSATLSLI